MNWKASRARLMYTAVAFAVIEVTGAVVFSSHCLQRSGPRAAVAVIMALRPSPASGRPIALAPMRLCREAFDAWEKADRERVAALLHGHDSTIASTPSTPGAANLGGGEFIQLCQRHHSLLVIGYIDTTFSHVGAGVEFRSYFLWIGFGWFHVRTIQTLMS